MLGSKITKKKCTLAFEENENPSCSLKDEHGLKVHGGLILAF